MVQTWYVSVPADIPLGLSRPHLVGIGEAGMAQRALLVASRGATVTGSDLRFTETIDRMKAASVSLHRESDHWRPLHSPPSHPDVRSYAGRLAAESQ
ncbi:Mur ligase domain-containing protein [Streptomyces sp. NBC_01278]|uniref:Mur ligase domain-containing protein n=1 Tax=Streptomyces sp. NBC_01278 TaxID=2903809 RepID=UPI003FCD0517